MLVCTQQTGVVWLGYFFAEQGSGYTWQSAKSADIAASLVGRWRIPGEPSCKCLRILERRIAGRES